MANQNLHNNHYTPWRIAYLARQLRHKKSITLTCLKTEACKVLEQLSTFSNCSPVMLKSIVKPNSKEVLLEIADRIY